MIPMATLLQREFLKTEQDLLSLFSLSSHSSEASSGLQEHHMFSLNHSYLGFSFVNIVLLYISGHSKVRHFARLLLSNQYITSCKISMNNLTQRENVSFGKYHLTKRET